MTTRPYPKKKGQCAYLTRRKPFHYAGETVILAAQCKRAGGYGQNGRYCKQHAHMVED